MAGAQSRAFELTGNGTSLGDGVALVMGGTGIPQPPQTYLDAVDDLFLSSHGFGGELVGSGPGIASSLAGDVAQP
ncbi:hypothetical protein GWR20_23430, partial [Mycolicibacter kumamotonensis]|nr:hypothetical protein [Mycolicibacter kumamotonensis]